MKLTFYGAAKTVTGSCFLLEANDERLLIDCGMFQGSSELSKLNEGAFGFDPKQITDMILTHAHIDHSGRIPKLVKEGFKGKIYATAATIDLCEIMLEDSAHIQESDAEYDSRKNKRKGLGPVEPLYTSEDALEAMKYFRPVELNNKITLNDTFSFMLVEAGHMLGSSIAYIFVTENGQTKKIVFSGDLGNENIPLLKDPSPLKDADYVVLESTYGGRHHTDRKGNENELLDVIVSTLEKKGTLVIPAFAVGRTQEMLYEINRFKENGMLGPFQDVKVVVDSPMAIKTTEIFKKYYKDFDKDTQDMIRSGDDPLVFDNLVYSMTTEESKAVNFDDSPKIIISASGMCDAGRIRHHIKHNIYKENCTLLFVGYQAEGSLGRLLLDGEKSIKLFGERIAVNARIVNMDYYSGHADHDSLIDWIANMDKKPEKVILVHGESDSLQALQKGLGEIGVESIIAEYLTTLDVQDGKTVASYDQKSIIFGDNSRKELSIYAEQVLDKLKDEALMKKVGGIDKIKLFLDCINDIISSE